MKCIKSRPKWGRSLHGFRIPLSGFPIPLLGFRIPLPGFWIPLLIYIYRFQVPLFGLDSRFHSLDSGFPSLYSGLHSMDSGFHSLDSVMKGRIRATYQHGFDYVYTRAKVSAFVKVSGFLVFQVHADSWGVYATQPDTTILYEYNLNAVICYFVMFWPCLAVEINSNKFEKHTRGSEWICYGKRLHECFFRIEIFRI